jgi:dual specificity tyrosine-phosphorylation-regulated kinase 2/3/4
MNGPNTARGQIQTLIPEESMNMTQGYQGNPKFA